MDEEGNPISLREKIKCAKTRVEVNNLLKEGTNYQFASPKTIRRINREAQLRLSVLSKGGNND